jgi:signal transduction histidine kinase
MYLSVRFPLEDVPLRVEDARASAGPAESGPARSEVVTAEEELRRRILSDIHDDTLQVLAEVAIRLDMLRTNHPELDQEEAFRDLGTSVRDAMDRLRSLMFNLGPADLDRRGLGSTLRRLVDVMQGRDAQIEFRLEDALDTEPAGEIRIALYRIAQEALTNVRKHAYAHSVQIVLDGTDGGVLMRISDDGKGFRVNEPAPSHYGLTMMRERAEAEGGWLRVLSAPGAGACIECWLPAEPGE